MMLQKHLIPIDTKFTFLAILMSIFENTMTKAICQLSVKFYAFCQLSVVLSLGLIFAEYVPLTSQSPYPIIVSDSVANYRSLLSHFWANM